MQADRSFAAELRLGIGPVEHLLAVHREPDPAADGEDLHLVPVVLPAGLLGPSLLVTRQAVAPIEVVEAPARRKHHEVALVARRLAVLLELLAPDRDARVHLARHERAFEEQPEVAIRLRREQIGAHLRGILGRVLADDLGSVDRPVGIDVPFPAGEVAAVEQPHGLPLLVGRKRHARGPVSGCRRLAGRRLEPGRGRAVVVEFAGSPESATGDEVEKLRHLHGVGVVADRRAEHPRAVVVVGPDDRLIALPLPAHRLGQRLRRRKQLVAEIHLLLRQLPLLRQPLQDRMVGDQVGRVVVMGPVPGRLDPAQLEPVFRARAIAMHRAVHHHRGHALPVLGDDSLHEVEVFHFPKALVVEDDVVAFRPVGLRVDRHLVVAARAPFMHHGHVHAGPLGHAIGDHLLLPVVVVAAAAGDVEHLQWLAGLGGHDSGPGGGGTQG